MTATSAQIAAEREAIERCETEPIHDIGTIQPGGCVVVCTRDGERITRASENIEKFIGRAVMDLLDRPISELFSRETVHSLRNISGHSTIQTQREYVGIVEVDGVRLDAAAFATADELIVELQHRTETGKPAESELDRVLRFTNRARGLTDIDQLLPAVTEELHRFLGYDRVKTYRFLPNGSGEVVAESRSAGLPSFLGLRFPDVDVPQSARHLYTTTPIRLLGSVGAEQSPIINARPDAEPLDLSLGLFRGLVDVHRSYLANMGVEATMSIPIVVHGRLWGLFALHHREERWPDARQTMSAEFLGRVISMQIQAIEDGTHARQIENCAAVASSLFVPEDSPLGVSAYWAGVRDALQRLVPSDGVALVGQSRIERHGHCPPDAVIHQLVVATAAQSNPSDRLRDPVVVDSVAELLSIPVENVADGDGPSICGALLLPDPVPAHQALVFFRDEAASIVRWAGNPTKDLVEDQDGLRLTPRASFAEYLESVDGRSDEWTTTDLAVVRALGEALDRRYPVAEAQSIQRARLGLVVRELDHRVRNILALVQSLVDQTRPQATSVNDYVLSLERRIQALADAHRVLTEFDWHDVSLERLLRQTLAGHQEEGSERIRVSGPAVTVPANKASLLSLVFHELASNATKYGALSSDAGVVDLTWQAGPEGLAIEWVESGGPPVAEPTRVGFGSSIIENALPYEFGGTSEIRFEPTGVRASIEVPDATDVEPVDLAAVASSDSTPSHLVLVVEDDYLVSRSMADALADFGVTNVETAATIDTALDAVARTSFDFAILDANLRGDFSGPVADALEAQEVPYLFVSGYGDKDQTLAAYSSLGIVAKPLRHDQLRDYLDRAGLSGTQGA